MEQMNEQERLHEEYELQRREVSAAAADADLLASRAEEEEPEPEGVTLALMWIAAELRAARELSVLADNRALWFAATRRWW